MADNSRPYGVGIAYRPELTEDLLSFRKELDLLELAAIDYTCRGWRMLQDPQEELLAKSVAAYPCVMHATSMSIGSVDPFDEDDVHTTLELMRKYGVTDFSEHLTFHRLGDIDIHSFMPMPFDEVSLDWVSRKYAAIRKRVSQPVGLENVSYLVRYPGCEMTEAQFLTELTKRTDCLLLLDVTNVFNNAYNHKYDPKEFIKQLPGDRIRQLHIAGGFWQNDAWIDSHSLPVMPEVWDLLDFTLKNTAAEMVILERDVDYFPFIRVRKDLLTAREIFYRNRPKQAPPGPASNSPPPASQVAAEAPNPDAPEFAELRDFQRGLIRMIAEQSYCERVVKDPDTLAEDFRLSPAWRRKLANCDQRFFPMLYERWQQKLQQSIDRDRDVAALEWRAWASA